LLNWWNRDFFEEIGLELEKSSLLKLKVQLNAVVITKDKRRSLGRGLAKEDAIKVV